MSNPLIKIVNVETGEETERPMSNDEFTQYQINQEALQTKKAEAAAKEAARQALLDKLGITAEEAQLLLG